MLPEGQEDSKRTAQRKVIGEITAVVANPRMIRITRAPHPDSDQGVRVLLRGNESTHISSVLRTQRARPDARHAQGETLRDDPHERATRRSRGWFRLRRLTKNVLGSGEARGANERRKRARGTQQ